QRGVFMRASQSGWITPLCPAGHLPLKGGDWLHRRPTRSRHPERREERSQRRKGVWLVPPQRGTTPGCFAATLRGEGKARRYSAGASRLSAASSSRGGRLASSTFGVTKRPSSRYAPGVR